MKFWVIVIGLFVLVGPAEMGGFKKFIKKILKQQISENVCYGSLGCFSSDRPFGGKFGTVPQSPDVIKTKFYLYTRKSRFTPQVLDAGEIQSAHKLWTSFKPRPTKIIIHGIMTNSGPVPWIQELTEELLKHDDYNIIVVDWSKGSKVLVPQSLANGRLVGAQTAQLIHKMMELFGITAEDFHLIGHSMGAHISGYVGDRVKSLGRISGLDPGGLVFEDADRLVRLDETDAIFVDCFPICGLVTLGSSTMAQVIRNIQDGARNAVGIKTPSGHLDFYPNLGYEQVGCPKPQEALVKILLKGLKGLADTFSCSHERAVQYFTESINTGCSFLAVPCNNEDEFIVNKCASSNKRCAHMGFHANKDVLQNHAPAKYFLVTRSSSPFCAEGPSTCSLKSRG